jgi:glycerophosphoryl diester phosphodiesterase
MKLLMMLGMIAGGVWGQTIQVHGHRGARAMRPENTLPAFEYAIAQGVDALELDMAVTKDGVLVVSHDPELRSPVCTGPRDKVAIHSLTLAEVREWDCGGKQNPLFAKQQTFPGTKMPTLDEVFALAPKGKFLFNIETKITPKNPELAPSPEEFVRLALAMIRKHHLEARVVLQSFDFRTLQEMKKAAPEIRLSALYSGAAKDFVEIAKEGRADRLARVPPGDAGAREGGACGGTRGVAVDGGSSGGLGEAGGGASGRNYYRRSGGVDCVVEGERRPVTGIGPRGAGRAG